MALPERIEVMTHGSEMGSGIGRWVASFGAGDIGYVAFLVSLIVLIATLSLLDPARKHGGEPQFTGLYLAAVILLAAVSLAFLTVNALWAIAALIRRRSAAKPLIGCALVILCVAVPLLWANLSAIRQARQAPVPALVIASASGNLEGVQVLLAHGADVNAKRSDGRTALMQASSFGHLEVLQALLANGADVNAKDSIDGETALMLASLNSPLEAVQALLAKGADVNAKDAYGRTALMQASSFGRLEVVQALLAKGADVNAKRRTDGATALTLARQGGHADVSALLLRAGAKP